MDIISKQDARGIAETASTLRGYGSYNSTGEYVIGEDRRGEEVYIDIFKHSDNGKDYFAISMPYEEQCELYYTKSDSIEELTALILEIAKNNCVEEASS